MDQLSQGQIKKSIKQLKQREEQYTYYLGQLAFQAGEMGKLQDPVMLEAYRTLKDIQTQIAQWEASMEQMKAAKEAAQNPRCPNCGGTASRDAAFCPRCGAAMAAPQTSPAAAPVTTAGRCSGCGAVLDDDAVFCGNCGTRAGLAAPAGAATVASSVQPAAPAPPAAQAPPPPPGQAAPAEAAGVAVQAEATRDSAAEHPASEAEEPIPSLEETHACPKCGTGIPEKDMIFCPSCGTKVRE